MRKAIIFSITFIFLISSLLGAISELMTYQGKLTDTDGIGINGTYEMTFRIYEVETGGSFIWEEAHNTLNAIEVTKGLFSVILGTRSPINLDFDGQYYMEIVIDGEAMSPRIALTAEGYAFRAKYADNIISGQSLSDVLAEGNSTDDIAIRDDGDEIIEVESNIEIYDEYGIYTDILAAEGATDHIQVEDNIDVFGNYINNSRSTYYDGKVAFNDNIVPVNPAQDLGYTSYRWDDIFLGSDSRMDISGDIGSVGDVLKITGSGMEWQPEATGDDDWTITAGTIYTTTRDVAIGATFANYNALHVVKHSSGAAAISGCAQLGSDLYARGMLGMREYAAAPGDHNYIGVIGIKENQDGIGPGVYAWSRDTDPTNWGLYAIANGITTGCNMAIYGKAVNGARNFAGYFDGDIAIKGNIEDSDSEVGLAGQVLGSNGTSVDWIDISASATAAGSSGELQINIEGEFGSDPYLKWDSVNNGLIIGTAASSPYGLVIDHRNAFVDLKSDGFAGVIVDRGSNTDNGFIVYSTNTTEEWYAGQISNGIIANSDYSISRTAAYSDGTFYISRLLGNIGINTDAPGSRLHIVENEDEYAKFFDNNYGEYLMADFGRNQAFGAYFNCASTDSNSRGLTAIANYTGTANLSYTQGAIINAFSTTQDSRGIICEVNQYNDSYNSYGIYSDLRAFSATSSADIRGIYSTSSHNGSGSNYGLYVATSGGSPKWDGYFSSGNIYVSGSCTGCDLAELFPAVEKYQPGMLVSLKENEIVELSTMPYDSKTMGIVSENYSVLIGNSSLEEEVRPQLESLYTELGDLDISNTDNNAKVKELEREISRLQSITDPASSDFAANDVPVALVGRVPLNVTDESGMIKAGDLITTSNTPGHGMKVTKAGPYFAVALEDQKYAIDQILAKVSDGYYTPSNESQSNNSNIDAGTATMQGKSMWIEFDKNFTESLNSNSPIITITANHPEARLYITERNSTGFRVKLANDVDEEFSFDWIGVGR